MSILQRDWHAVPGASDQEVQRLVDVVPFELPGAYLALLRLSNGGEGPLSRDPFYLCLDPSKIVADTAASGRQNEFFPGFLIIGSNGGGEFIAFNARIAGELPVVALDMNNADLRDTILPIASNFEAFMELIGFEAED